jgi:DNA polymerase III alpha subunit
MFAALHVHSEHSAGYGTASVAELAERAAACGYAALALTDVENLYGQPKLHAAARHFGVRPITGVELRWGFAPGRLGRKAGRIVLLARDLEGYESLCRVVTRRRHGFAERPTPDPLDALASEPRGVFWLSDDPSAIESLLAHGVRADDVRFLLVRPQAEIRASPPRSVKTVLDPDVVMLDSSDHPLHVLQIAVRTRRPVSAVHDAESRRRTLPTAQALAALAREHPEAAAETLAVAAACRFELAQVAPRLPALHAPEESAAGRLRRLARAGLVQLHAGNGHAGAEYDARLERELDAIEALGYADAMLVAHETAEVARERGMPVLARGSAVASLVVHALGWSPVDPLVRGLAFERFLHAHRAEPPDVDFDVPSDRRDELLAATIARFGPERAAMVSAHVTLGRRAALRAGLEAYGATRLEIDRAAAALPPDEIAPAADTPFAPALVAPRLREVLPWIQRLVGKPDHVAVHSSALAVAAPRLDRVTPLERAPKGVAVTQYDGRGLEALGLVRIDLLGNRALSAIEAACTHLGRVPAMPDGDPATLAVLARGATIGCSQIESPLVRQTLRRVPQRGIADLVATLALVRPGPASGDAKAQFVARARGEAPAHAPHPRLAPLLAETYGIVLYDEQVTFAIAEITGWPLARADAAREALVHSDAEPASVAALGEEVAAAAAAAGPGALPREEALAIWRHLARFAAYSFHKAHASAIAELAWRCAFLATHHPAAFACGVLDHYGGPYPLRAVAADFVRRGLAVRGPHVSRSRIASVPEDGGVRLGLRHVGWLSDTTRARAIAERPFADLRDFVLRVSPARAEIEALVHCGACDGLAPLPADGDPIALGDALARLAESGPAGLRTLVPRRAQGERAATYRALVRARNQLRVLGTHPDAHPIAALREEAVAARCVPIAEVASRHGRRVRVVALLDAMRRVETSRGRLHLLTIEDESAVIEATHRSVPGEALDPFTTPGPYLFQGTAGEDFGEGTLSIEEIAPFHLRREPYGPAARGVP